MAADLERLSNQLTERGFEEGARRIRMFGQNLHAQGLIPTNIDDVQEKQAIEQSSHPEKISEIPLGEMLYRLRVKSNISINTVAAIAGESLYPDYQSRTRFLVQIELGYAQPAPDFLEKMAQIFGVDIEDLKRHKQARWVAKKDELRMFHILLREFPISNSCRNKLMRSGFSTVSEVALYFPPHELLALHQIGLSIITEFTKAFRAFYNIPDETPLVRTPLK